MSFRGLLNKTCDIKRPTQTQSNTGAPVKSFSVIASAVPCRSNPERKPSVDNTLGVVKVITHKFYLETSVDIRNGDLIVFEGSNFEVVLAVKDSSNHHYEVDTNRVSFV